MMLREADAEQAPVASFDATDGRSAPVPRHREIKGTLCALIRRQLEIV